MVLPMTCHHHSCANCPDCEDYMNDELVKQQMAALRTRAAKKQKIITATWYDKGLFDCGWTINIFIPLPRWLRFLSNAHKEKTLP